MAVSKAIKRRTHRLVKSKHMLKGITVASFLESTIVPVPLEAVLVPLMQARREQLWLIALMATVGCAVGALFGYALGYYLFDVLGDWLIQLLSSPEQFEQVKSKMAREGFWFVLTLGVAPIPFQIAMLAAGATQYSLPWFLLATVLARSLRYFGLALVVYIAGNEAERLIRRYNFRAIAFATAVVLGLWALSAWLGG
ncbi:VTT domain-containing protein [Alteromonas sp. ASW11-19]|uniref:VTT domain-containing protein n=1 Tax=Alteromonas salexigens TaxID=2982530 RepID=A0ABT2VJZ1_9ALTE|nr:VTT domain-containing protein [Alteromonas salexigens]MCU7553582.1 VTT domain-containing protein [Alteromonas salexigens]